MLCSYCRIIFLFWKIIPTHYWSINTVPELSWNNDGHWKIPLSRALPMCHGLHWKKGNTAKLNAQMQALRQSNISSTNLIPSLEETGKTSNLMRTYNFKKITNHVSCSKEANPTHNRLSNWFLLVHIEYCPPS